MIRNALFLQPVSEVLDRFQPVRNKHVGLFNVVKIVYPVKGHRVHFKVAGVTVQLGYQL